MSTLKAEIKALGTNALSYQLSVNDRISKFSEQPLASSCLGSRIPPLMPTKIAVDKGATFLATLTVSASRVAHNLPAFASPSLLLLPLFTSPREAISMGREKSFKRAIRAGGAQKLNKFYISSLTSSSFCLPT
jgi:hypothetical protein